MRPRRGRDSRAGADVAGPDDGDDEAGDYCHDAHEEQRGPHRLGHLVDRERSGRRLRHPDLSERGRDTTRLGGRWLSVSLQDG